MAPPRLIIVSGFTAAGKTSPCQPTEVGFGLAAFRRRDDRGNQHIRRVLMGAIAALSSPAGYVYTSSGHMKSARTYSILMDTLWRLDQTLAASSYMESVSTVANVTVRVLHSRAVNWFVLLGACFFGGVSLWTWAFDQRVFLSSAGTEFFGAGVLAVAGYAQRRIRRR